jgi:uncharacterized protein (TIGR00255 family)
MLRSMTAYTSSRMRFSDFECTCEIQSLNKRHLEVQLQLPFEFLSHDILIRKAIAQKISRGTLKVIIRTEFFEDAPIQVKVKAGLAKKLLTALEELEHSCGIKKDGTGVFFEFLDRFNAIEVVPMRADIENYSVELLSLLNEGLDDLLKTKEKEGSLIEKEFQDRISLIEKKMKEIETFALEAPANFRKKLQAIVQASGINFSEHFDIRFAQEVALLSEKADISEEISRFKMGLIHFQEELQKPTSGKTLDFILQELFREINTMGSKAQDAVIIHSVVDIKGELEKMREQVQNVE